MCYVVPFRALVTWIRVIQSDVALRNRHKSETDYLILDGKKWDFQIQIIWIQIKFSEQLAPNDFN